MFAQPSPEKGKKTKDSELTTKRVAAVEEAKCHKGIVRKEGKGEIGYDRERDEKGTNRLP